MTQSVAAILLAAGNSRRMGTCKQLLQLEGKSVLALCLETLLAGGVEDMVVVISASGDEVAEATTTYPVQVIRNPDPDGDRASSVRIGRDALASSVTGILIALCDYPLIAADTISGSLERHRVNPGNIIIPCHKGRRGHRTLFPRSLLDDLAAPRTLRDLLHHHPERIRHLEVQDPGVLLDMDTPDDFRRITDLCAARRSSPVH